MAAALKPTTLLAFHRAMKEGKYRRLFSPQRRGKPGLKGPSKELVQAIVEMKRRDRRAALKFLKRTMKRYGRPRSIVTDRLRSYVAAMKAMGIVERQECGRWLNNRTACHWRTVGNRD